MIEIKKITISNNDYTVDLSCGQVIRLSISRYPRLALATEEQLKDCELLGDGEGLHWPQLDEDLQLKGAACGVLKGVEVDDSASDEESLQSAVDESNMDLLESK